MDPVVTSIAVEPAILTVQRGRRNTIRVVAIFSDGRVVEVTSEAAIVSGNEAIAKVLPEGVIEGVAFGQAIISASWQCLEASANANVYTTDGGTGTGQNPACKPASESWDVAFIADDALVVYPAPYSGYGELGADGIQGAIYRPVHRVYQTSPTAFARSYPTAALSLQLSMDLRVPWDPDAPAGPFRDRIAHVSDREVRGWSDTVQPWTLNTSDLGGAMMLAIQTHVRGRQGVNKLIVVYSTGGESFCNPSLRTAATVAKNAGILVAVVSPLTGNEPQQYTSFCDYPISSFLYLSETASDCLFFPAVATGALQSNVFNSVVLAACNAKGGDCRYYTRPSGVGLHLV